MTVQYCITSEALNAKNHAFGGTWGGEDSTFHHNLFACNTGRNPSIGMGGEFDYRNNVIFNWRHRTMDGGDETSLDQRDQQLLQARPGHQRRNARARSPASRSAASIRPAGGSSPAIGIPKRAGRPGKWYVAGNLMEGSPEVTADNWLGMHSQSHGDASQDARVNTPFEAWPVNQQTAQEAYQVGARQSRAPRCPAATRSTNALSRWSAPAKPPRLTAS